MRFDDLDRVYNLEMESFPNPWPKSFFENDLRSKDTVALVVENQGAIIGFTLLSCENDKIHVTNIAVAQQYQRQGIASQLMRHAESIALERDCGYAYLEVRTNNVAAINLYLHLGYDISYTRKHYYIDGDDAYVMTKELK